jgi:hypothetical protein
MPPANKQKPVWLFVALCVVCIALTVGYIWQTSGEAANAQGEALPEMASSPILELERAPEPGAATTPTPEAAPEPEAVPRRTPGFEASESPSPVPGGIALLAKPVAVPAPLAAEPAAPTPAPAAPLFLVRHTGTDKSYGRLAAETADGREATQLNCERVYFAAGRGICLDARRGAITTYSAILFDAKFQPSATLQLPGIPSRTRISPDGRYAAFTVFVSGHSYDSAGFSTHTAIIDSVTGTAVIPNLEQMEVWSNGSRLQAADFNFWGVTFARDSNRFYATLGTGGVAYLVEGDIAANKATVIKAGIECPSLSPDNTRLAFKKRVPGAGLPKWRIAVLDLASLTESFVAEERYVDEQLVWLDDNRILYTQAAEGALSRVVTDVWVVPADGTGTPALLLKQAASPTPVRAAIARATE